MFVFLYFPYRNCNDVRLRRLEAIPLFRRSQKVFVLQQAMASRNVGKFIISFLKPIYYD